MMHDDDLEHLLRRYRPVGPSPDLRARALVPRAASAWPWLAAAAALLLFTGGIERLNGHLVARADVLADPDPEVVAVEQLADLLGGGSEGRAAAALVLAGERRRAEQNRTDAAPAEALRGATP